MRNVIEEVDLLEILDERHMAFLQSCTAKEAVTALVSLLEATGALSNKEEVIECVMQREKIVSTGVGLGVALPHARMEGIADFFIAVGVQQSGPIAWESLDDIPVRLVFLIVGPANEETLYLKVLSKLTEWIRGAEFRQQVLSASSISDLVKLFQTCYSDSK